MPPAASGAENASNRSVPNPASQERERACEVSTAGAGTDSLGDVVSVAFFRNMNLGHARSPDRESLERAFVDAGASAARAFQTNGTIVFTAPNASRTATQARDRLRTSGYDDAVFVRDHARLAQIIDQFPRLPSDSDHYREMVAFFDLPHADGSPSHSSERVGLVRVLHVEHDHSLGLIWKPKSSAGNITQHLERHLGTVATSRTLGTLQRLLKQL